MPCELDVLGDLADLSVWLPLAAGILTAGLVFVAGRVLLGLRCGRRRVVDPLPLIEVAFGLGPPSTRVAQAGPSWTERERRLSIVPAQSRKTR
jgi:hypothetical protein